MDPTRGVGSHQGLGEVVFCSSVHGPDSLGTDPCGTSSPQRREHNFGATLEPSKPPGPTFGSVFCTAPARQPLIPQHPPTPNRPNPLKQSLNPGELSEAERGSCTVPWLNSALIPEQTALIPEHGSLPPPARGSVSDRHRGSDTDGPGPSSLSPGRAQGPVGGTGPGTLWLSPLRAGQLLARATLGSCPRHRLASAIFKAPV